MRITYSFVVLITIICGLLSRKYSLHLPQFIAENAGDAIWAMMVYFGFRFLLVRKSLLIAFLFSFFFCFGIEFSQLYQEDWINQIRATTLGALVLGKGFLAVDLMRYTVGIVIATGLDWALLKLTVSKQ